jgi:hypothetical protein
VFESNILYDESNGGCFFEDIPYFEKALLKGSRDIIIQSILYNAHDSVIEISDDCHYYTQGNFIDCALKWFLV